MKHYTEWPMDEEFEQAVQKIERRMLIQTIALGTLFYFLGVASTLFIVYLVVTL